MTLAGAALSLGLTCTAHAAGAAARAVDPTLPVIAFHAGLSSLNPRDPVADRRLVRWLAAKTFDMEAMARAVLGDQAGRSTPAQRVRLEDVFVKLIAGRIEKDPSVGPNSTIAVVKVTPLRSGDEWLVATRTTRGKATAPLTWRVRAEPGGPRIVDVLRAGSSLTAVENARVAGDLRTRGIDYVITELDKSTG
ncbi:MAG TPA: ABC transporter substrate-binding protein [Caulobacteraceae bacterium]|nr:ABC transporter substrate-binding protein [Caulobacteraceae bacterium]